MAFDESGIWHSEITHEPQTGALGALQILNQFQSQGNYQRNRAGQLLDQILKLRNQGGSDVSQTPEGGQAMETLGISPESVQGTYAKTPEAQFRSGMSDIVASGKTPTMEDVTRIGLPAGAISPQQVLSPFGRIMKSHETEQHDAAGELMNIYKTISPRFGGEQPGELASATKAIAMSQRPDYWKGREPELDAAIAALQKGEGGVAAAREENLLSHANLYDEQRDAIKRKLPSEIDKNWAIAHAAEARAATAGIYAEVARGKLSQERLRDLGNEVVHGRQIVAGLAKAAAQIGIIPGAAKPILDQIKPAQEFLDRAETALAAQSAAQLTAPAAAPKPAGKKTETKAKQFPSQEAFVTAFSEHPDPKTGTKRPPTPKEIENARAAGLF